MRMQPAKIAVIGIDLGKNSCSLAALDSNGAVVKRRRVRPDSTVAFAEGLPACDRAGFES
jgi:transposase